MGKAIVLSMASFKAALLVNSGAAIDRALEEVVGVVTEKLGHDTIGFLGIDKTCRVAAAFYTHAMARG
mgnify:CR=1 FL=1